MSGHRDPGGAELLRRITQIAQQVDDPQELLALVEDYGRERAVEELKAVSAVLQADDAYCGCYRAVWDRAHPTVVKAAEEARAKQARRAW